MLHARKTGKIQYGEIKIGGYRIGRLFKNELQRILGMDIDLSIIKIDGPFDVGPFIYFS
jgi:hypothetical protein